MESLHVSSDSLRPSESNGPKLLTQALDNLDRSAAINAAYRKFSVWNENGRRRSRACREGKKQRENVMKKMSVLGRTYRAGEAGLRANKQGEEENT